MFLSRLQTAAFLVFLAIETCGVLAAAVLEGPGTLEKRGLRARVKKVIHALRFIKAATPSVEGGATPIQNYVATGDGMTAVGLLNHRRSNLSPQKGPLELFQVVSASQQDVSLGILTHVCLQAKEVGAEGKQHDIRISFLTHKGKRGTLAHRLSSVTPAHYGNNEP